MPHSIKPPRYFYPLYPLWSHLLYYIDYDYTFNCTVKEKSDVKHRYHLVEIDPIHLAQMYVFCMFCFVKSQITPKKYNKIIIKKEFTLNFVVFHKTNNVHYKIKFQFV